jgi:hypothetical protein
MYNIKISITCTFSKCYLQSVCNIAITKDKRGADLCSLCKNLENMSPLEYLNAIVGLVDRESVYVMYNFLNYLPNVKE